MIILKRPYTNTNTHFRHPTRSRQVERWELREICEFEFYPWPQVSEELRRRSILRAVASLTARTPAGIVMSEAAFDALDLGLAPMCPFKLKFVSKTTFSRVTLERKCGSWACRMCGPRLADNLLKDVTLRTFGLESLYVAEALWQPKLAAMMNHRYRDHGIEYFWSRDISGKVTYVAERPLPGRKAPCIWRRMTRDEALDLLRNDRLWVPGHEDHGFTAGWKPAEDEPNVTDLLSLQGLTEDQVAIVMEMFYGQAEQLFGIRVQEEAAPDEHLRDLELLLRMIIRWVRDGNV